MVTDQVDKASIKLELMAGNITLEIIDKHSREQVCIGSYQQPNQFTYPGKTENAKTHQSRDNR